MVRLHGFRHKGGSEGATVGPLSSLSLAEIAQTLNLGAKTARVDLHKDGERGSVWFVSGTPVHASCGGVISGAPAFYRMLGWKSGEFVIEHAATTDKRSLEGDPMYHVLEGLRRVDEQGDGSTPVPLPPIPEPQRSSHRVPILLGMMLVCLAGAAWWLWAAGPDSAPSAVQSEGPVVASEAVPLAPSHGAAARVRTAPKKSTPAPRAIEPAPAMSPAAAAAVETQSGGPPLEPSVPGTAADQPAGPAAPVVADAAPQALGESPAAPAPLGRVGLVLRSKLKEGTLTLLIDGQPVYSAPLQKTSVFTRRRDAADRFAATIPVSPGSHGLVARIDLGGGAAISTAEVAFNVEPEIVTELTVVAGAKQTRPLAIEIGGVAATGPESAQATGGAGAAAAVEIDGAPLEQD